MPCVAAGASVVISAGNAGLAVGQPANCNGAIAVGGLRHTGTKVGFSDLGTQIAISAPGGNCVITDPTDPCLYPDPDRDQHRRHRAGHQHVQRQLQLLGGHEFLGAAGVGHGRADAVGQPDAVTDAGTRDAAVLGSRLSDHRRRPRHADVTTCALPQRNSSSATAPPAPAAPACSTCAPRCLAVPAPSTTQALAFATPAAPAPGGTVTLDGSTSVPASGQTIDRLPVDPGRRRRHRHAGHTDQRRRP